MCVDLYCKTEYEKIIQQTLTTNVDDGWWCIWAAAAGIIYGGTPIPG